MQISTVSRALKKTETPIIKVPGSFHHLTCQMLPYQKHWKLVPYRRLVQVTLAHQVKKEVEHISTTSQERNKNTLAQQ